MNRKLLSLATIITTLILVGCNLVNPVVSLTSCIFWLLTADSGTLTVDNNGDGTQTVGIRVFDGNGTLIFSDPGYRTGSVGFVSTSVIQTELYTTAPDYNPITFELYSDAGADLAVDTIWLTATDDCGSLPTYTATNSTNSDDDSNIVYPPDDRINWQYGDLNVVVYDHEDGVVAYCYDGNTWVGLHITQASVDNATLAQAQDVPVLEYDENGCRVAFYMLDSGEYQINIWTWDGKLYELIADNLDFANATMRYFDPGE